MPEILHSPSSEIWTRSKSTSWTHRSQNKEGSLKEQIYPKTSENNWQCTLYFLVLHTVWWCFFFPLWPVIHWIYIENMWHGSYNVDCTRHGVRSACWTVIIKLDPFIYKTRSHMKLKVWMAWSDDTGLINCLCVDEKERGPGGSITCQKFHCLLGHISSQPFKSNQSSTDCKYCSLVFSGS